MVNHRIKQHSAKLFLTASVAALAFMTTPAVLAQGTTSGQVSSAVMINGFTPRLPSAPISQFVPQTQTVRTRLDYSIYDEALDGSVLVLGASTRRFYGRPAGDTGSRIATGHRSPYRLEGSRVSFSFLNAEYKEAFAEYRKDLERIGTQIDLTRMSKNEQLAFWLNLHNVTVIEQISQRYPVRRPSDIKIDGIDFHDAKILNIKGVPLSLRDIRERIVFPNWSNPETMYGFFYGDIGSPALPAYAYTADNVSYGLTSQAGEFVNALRGFNETSRAREVSRLYAEAQPFYFKNWERDLEAHLLKHADKEVRAEILTAKPFVIDRYDDVIADLMGGDRPRIAVGALDRDVNDPFGSGQLQSIPPEVLRLLEELKTKRRVLINRGMIRRGTVIIEDIETPLVTTPQPYDPNVDPESQVYDAPPEGGL